MYTIGICDDEPVFLKDISAMTADILKEAGIPFQIHTFENTKHLDAYLRSPEAKMDLLLLDILMQEQTGLAYAARLRDEGNLLPIIFVTTTIDFVLDGYKVEPLGYLLKPLQRPMLREALLRAFRHYQSQNIVLQSSSHSVSFHRNSVLYLDIQNKELRIHLSDESVLYISIPLNSLFSKLPAEQFVQCHRSYIVSLPAIASIWRYGIELTNHETIPVSKTYYAQVQEALMRWVSQL